MGSLSLKMIPATSFLLLLQAAAYQQAALNKNPEPVINDAAQSLEDLLGLDYQVGNPMFKDIGIMKKRLVELMPHLEEAERPVITKAYAKLLDLEGTVQVNFGTPLGLLADKATKEGEKMKGKIEEYPGKFRSSLRTLKSFLARVSTNVDDLTEASEKGLTQAKTVLIAVEAFKKMMSQAKSEEIKTQTFQSFIDVTDITKSIDSEDATWRDAFSFVENLIPKLVSFGLGLKQIFETPDLKSKIEKVIEKNNQIVKILSGSSLALNKAKNNLKLNSMAVADLKDNSDNYNPEKVDVNLLKNKFDAISKAGEKVGKIAAFALGYQPIVLDIPAARTPTTTTTTTTPKTTATPKTTPTSTTTTNRAVPSEVVQEKTLS